MMQKILTQTQYLYTNSWQCEDGRDYEKAYENQVFNHFL